MCSRSERRIRTRGCWARGLGGASNIAGTGRNDAEILFNKKVDGALTRGFIGMLKHADGKPAQEFSRNGAVSDERREIFLGAAL